MGQPPSQHTKSIPSGRPMHIFVAICFVLAVLMAFQIVSEDPQIAASVKKMDKDDHNIKGNSIRESSTSLSSRKHGAIDKRESINSAINTAMNSDAKRTSQKLTDQNRNSTTLHTTTTDSRPVSIVNSSKTPYHRNNTDLSMGVTKFNSTLNSNETEYLKNNTVASKRTVSPNNTTNHTTQPLSTKRIQILNHKGKFSFVHIPKAAGSTWIRTLNNLPLKVCPDAEAGKEYPVSYQNHHKCTDFDYQMLSLRSPRHHVWSLFTECKYDAWGKKVTKGLGFPRSGTNATSDEFDFNSWLDHFLPMSSEHEDNFKCYHPANLQTRYLESEVSAAHGVLNRPNDTTRFEGNITVAKSTYWDQDFVAIVELHHESLCLFYHRLGSEAPKKARHYVNAQCVCPKPTATDKNLKEIHVVHHDNGHRKELRHLPEKMLMKVETLTAVDRKLYLFALRQILVEIAWLESSLGLDRRILCDDVLEKLQPELEYLNISLLQLYQEAKA